MTSQTITHEFVQWIASHQGYQPIEPPKLADDLVCPHCGGSEYFTWYKDPSINSDRVWFCARVCELSKLPNHVTVRHGPKKMARAVEWPLFCECNGIGDLYHGIRFEMINQSLEKIRCLQEFAQKPSGIILMQGPKGTGKTFACYGLCELVTRASAEVMLFTHAKLAARWLQVIKQEDKTDLIERLHTTRLLVIDDFGTMAPSDGFMQFFMELIDSRMQWRERGTVITTNLSDQLLGKYCGEALSDRIKTGRHFVFEGKSRRVMR